jgi:hypothetical protein
MLLPERASDVTSSVYGRGAPVWRRCSREPAERRRVAAITVFNNREAGRDGSSVKNAIPIVRGPGRRCCLDQLRGSPTRCVEAG